MVDVSFLSISSKPSTSMPVSTTSLSALPVPVFEVSGAAAFLASVGSSARLSRKTYVVSSLGTGKEEEPGAVG